MSLVKPKHIASYGKYITQLISDLGQPVNVCTTTPNTACPNCVYDAAHKCSSGKYNGTGAHSFTGGICPVCKGKGSTVTTTVTSIIATVNWVQSVGKEDIVVIEAGTIENTLCKIKTLVANYDTLKNADYIVVNGVRTKLINIVKRGLKNDVVCIAICKRDD